jgi:hypothetical protein
MRDERGVEKKATRCEVAAGRVQELYNFPREFQEFK